MKIYTKTGDDGTTGLFGGTRMSKGALRLEVCGTIDELNSWIGLLGDYTINADQVDLLRSIQSLLFTIGANVMTESGKKSKKIPVLDQTNIIELEKAIDQMETQLDPIRFFILPGGHKEVSFCHIARTVCRRAERVAVRLHAEEPMDVLIIQYLNRLSDYLFTLCRYMAHRLEVQEIPWKPETKM